MINQLETIQKIKDALGKAKRVLVIGHQQPDGDALGALIGLAYYLKSLNKDYSLFCLDAPVEQYQFLPLIHEVKADPQIFEEKLDLIIVVDSGDLHYAGVDKLLPPVKNYTLINIDHHASNNFFGDLNLVLPDKSSTSEIIYQLLRLWQAPINKEAATALLNGIIFDTGSFGNSATSLSSLEAAGHLLNLGARHRLINENILRNKSLGLLKLWGRAFEKLQFNQKYDLAFTVVTQEDLIACGVEAEASSGISNFFNELAGAKIAMVLVQTEDNVIKGSLRTTRDDVDVAALAKQFGGGGHKKAAGFTIPGQLVYNEGRWQIID
ncbi:MAG: bifunctional oligoribonuclease/PAP phosphatase NrnA [bacterium]|nr:bifunctional oligoribonuclease/PAP phosphatase NrnA [bacterium]